MKLLLVESPSKAVTINQYLGKSFTVKSTYGHIRSLPSEVGSVQPDKDFLMRFEILDKSKKNVDEIVKNYKQCSELLLATDPDREGEAISWHIVEALKERKVFNPKIPIRRVVFHEITKAAILKAIDNPRSINQDLVEAQQARQALDYLVGFTLSPVLWRKLPGSRSAGRVQSVALRIISDREDEIECFKTEEYWTIEANFLTNNKQNIPAKLWQYKGDRLEKFSITNQTDANKIANDLNDDIYAIHNVEKREINRQPPPPFTTSTMLQEAARKLGFSAKKTSKIAQDLYEGLEIKGKKEGLITYMRTDSVSVSQEALDNSRKFIDSYFGNKYLPAKVRYFKTKTKNAQEAHEAIRPTKMDLLPEEVKANAGMDHYKLYSLIWRRMMASQMSNAVLDSVTLEISNKDKNNIFRATGSTIKFDGFLKLYIKEKSSDDKEEILPAVVIGQAVNLDNIRPDQHFTEPPPRFTEASLVKKLEELGIGRPSTYPSIIAVLQDRGYVIVDKKRFAAVPKGRIVSAFLTSFFEKYVEYDFTAKLENELDDISNGEASSKSVLSNFWTPFKTRIDEVLLIKGSEILEKMEEKLKSYLFKDDEKHTCSECNKGEMKLKNGKFGPFLGCSNYPNCKNIQRIPDITTSQEVAVPTNSNEGGGLQLPHNLGNDSDGRTYIIKRGPYGVYLEAAKDKDVKRVKIPNGQNISELSLEYAILLGSMPRTVGDSKEFGFIKAGYGRFGPYVEVEGKYISIKGQDPVSITLAEAEQIIRDKKASPAASRYKPKNMVKKKVVKKAKTKPKIK